MGQSADPCPRGHTFQQVVKDGFPLSSTRVAPVISLPLSETWS